MYERFYGLQQRPFNLTSNPRYLLLTPAHAEALSSVQYGIGSRVGIIVLLGEAGTGKTSVIRAAMASQPPGGRFVMMNNPLLSRSEFFQHVAHGFGLSDDAVASKPRFLSELSRVLEESVHSGRQTGLIVDEAHALPYEILEEIRLLANMETDDEKLLPVLLAGQPELGERLNNTNLRQLKQRVALRCSLRPLRLRETAAYIAGRIGVAGGDAGTLFTAGAVQLIHKYSGGVPRTISVICDNALVTGFAADQRPIDAGIVREVCRDLDLTAEPERQPPTPAPALSPEESPAGLERGAAVVGSFRRFFS